MKKIFLTLSIATIAFLANAQSDILGTWYNGSKSGKIQITENNGKYVGKIVWLEEPISTKTNKPKVDENNPDKTMRNNPIVGLAVVKGFTFEGNGVFGGGSVYDPENGKSYKGKITLIDKNNLDLRGYIGIPALGRTEKWTRTTK